MFRLFIIATLLSSCVAQDAISVGNDEKSDTLSVQKFAGNTYCTDEGLAFIFQSKPGSERTDDGKFAEIHALECGETPDI